MKTRIINISEILSCEQNILLAEHYIPEHKTEECKINKIINKLQRNIDKQLDKANQTKHKHLKFKLLRK